MPLHNEYFSNDEDGQNKATELVGYILPVPLEPKKNYLMEISAYQNQSLIISWA